MVRRSFRKSLPKVRDWRKTKLPKNGDFEQLRPTAPIRRTCIGPCGCTKFPKARFFSGLKLSASTDGSPASRRCQFTEAERLGRGSLHVPYSRCRSKTEDNSDALLGHRRCDPATDLHRREVF